VAPLSAKSDRWHGTPMVLKWWHAYSVASVINFPCSPSYDAGVGPRNLKCYVSPQIPSGTEPCLQLSTDSGMVGGESDGRAEKFQVPHVWNVSNSCSKGSWWVMLSF